jgi:dihydroorotase
MSTATTDSLLIANARLLDPSDGYDAIGYLGIRNGRIVHRDRKAPADAFDRTIDAAGRWLMPGIVDLSARLREPGATHKASIRSETAAAAAAGITTLCLPPDTRPVIDQPSVLDRIRGIVHAASNGVHVLTLGALTQGLAGEVLAEMSALRDGGCVGVSQGLAPIADWRVARRALEYAAGLGLTVHVVPLDPHLGVGGCAHEGAVATRLGLPSVPVAAEVAAIRAWISMVEDTGARVHFGRLSSARAVELMESAKNRNLPVTADVAAHQLFLTDEAIADFNALCHVVPVLRESRDRDALRDGLHGGVIDAVCSDHQPHEADAKVNPFPWTEPGISGLDTLLPLTLELVHIGKLSPLALVDRLAAAPARILGLNAVTLAAGAIADVVLVDPDIRWRADPEAWRSAGRNSPFLGAGFRGRATATIAGGQLLATDAAR